MSDNDRDTHKFVIGQSVCSVVQTISNVFHDVAKN